MKVSDPELNQVSSLQMTLKSSSAPASIIALKKYIHAMDLVGKVSITSFSGFVGNEKFDLPDII